MFGDLGARLAGTRGRVAPAAAELRLLWTCLDSLRIIDTYGSCRSASVWLEEQSCWFLYASASTVVSEVSFGDRATSFCDSLYSAQITPEFLRLEEAEQRLRSANPIFDSIHSVL
jgi:hypothetical protein